eukprot:2223369-Prymnesium_polylepis.1
MPFPSRTVLVEQTPHVVVHFGCWGMEVHSGLKTPDGVTLKESKPEILFCAADPTCIPTPPPSIVLTSRTCCCQAGALWPSSPSS